MDLTLQIIKTYSGTTALNVQLTIDDLTNQFGNLLSRAKQNVPEMNGRFEALGFTRNATGFSYLKEAPSSEVNNALPVLLTELKDLFVSIFGVGNVIFSPPAINETVAVESVTVTEDITISLT